MYICNKDIQTTSVKLVMHIVITITYKYI